uniref:AT-rich binding protein n=1 Tax=Ceratitis capitata TaxID=7213 RepID=W8BQC6_CERCA
MNITRILGQNNKIYQKFGDYCITEAEPNLCCIICCFCQEQHDNEKNFWTHIKEMHDYAPTQLCLMQQKSTAASAIFNSTNDEPMYVDAEYMQGIVLNESNAFIELKNKFTNFNENKLCTTKSTDAKGHESVEIESSQPEIELHTQRLSDTLKTQLDIDKLAPKQFLESGILLKSLFQQIQRANNEFKYKLNKLTQAVQLIESELKKEPGQRMLKRYMKIIPDQPFTSRDEVLILDDELHHSKEMRDALHEETLAIATESADVFCRVLWRFIMTDEVTNQFCWRGVVNADKVIKYPIKDMTMLDVFQGVFREKFPEQTLNFFKDRTMAYFNKAHERLKRKQLHKADGNCVGNNSSDFLCNGTTTSEQDCQHKRMRNETENNDSVDSVFEEVFSG